MILSRIFSLPRLARRLLSRLLDREAAVRCCNFGLGPAQAPVARIANVLWRKDSVTISGRQAGGEMSFTFTGQPEQRLTATPFQITLPRPRGEARLVIACRAGDMFEQISLAPPSDWVFRVARLRALPGIGGKIWRERNGLFRFLRSGDAVLAQDIHQRLGLTGVAPGRFVPKGLFGAKSVRQPIRRPAVILPVYNAFDDLDCLLRRLPQGAGCDHLLVLVDDGSEDRRVRARLDQFSATHPTACRLLRLPENRGFVAAVNAGIELAMAETDGDLVLLNSDTAPPEGWLPRLLAPMEIDRNVASVTPMSNAAEILSVPVPGSHDLPGAEALAAMDRVAAGINVDFAQADLPTGVGFCMGMNRDFLERLGGFDPAFGRGYGEEVDWCRRAMRAGGRNLGLANLVVGHRGGASFGNAEKEARIRAASAEITRRYPSYDNEVQNWCETDPMAPARLALALAWLGTFQDRPCPIYLGHCLGGGAETALLTEIAQAQKDGAPGAVVIRTGGPLPWRIEIHVGEARLLGDLDDVAVLLELLEPLHVSPLIYSCGVGAADPMEVPRLLEKLAHRRGRFEIRLHDFFPLSPSWNLLGSDGYFAGIPTAESEDPAHQFAGPRAVSLADWRRAWRGVIAEAGKVTAYSRSSADLFAQAYPEARAKICVTPHQPQGLPPLLPTAGRNIGVLGSLNWAKGGGVIADLGAEMTDRKLVVFGQLDGRFRLTPPHRIHGGYRQAEIAELARRYEIGLWLIPSICPETFSFATHEALATGLPVLGFDIGAQGEAVSAAANGYVLPYDPGDIPALAGAIETVLMDQAELRFRSAS